MTKQTSFVFALIFLAATAGMLLAASNPEAKLKRFSSNEELASFLKANMENYSKGLGGFDRVYAAGNSFTAAAVAEASTSTATAADYSTTNVQIKGVDEADIVKSDGRFIYVITANKLVILDAYPAEEARVVSETKLKGHGREIFVNDDKLAVLGDDYSGSARMDVYDISRREEPRLAREISVSGSYQSARMIGNYVYAVMSDPVYYREYRGEGERPVPLPAIMENGVKKEIQPPEIYYFDRPDYSYSYVNIIAVNLLDGQEPYNSKTFLTGQNQLGIYASNGNIYLANTVHENSITPAKAIARAAVDSSGVAGQVLPSPSFPREQEERTIIQKISISKGNIEYKGEGSVPGHILNQFSMDEHEGYFRIATTSTNRKAILTSGQSLVSEQSIKPTSRMMPGNYWSNNIYVLDDRMNIVGSVEDLAPGEKIYSARFMGDRAYLVTFKKVDPLFVIDLSEPANPQVLGKLKIPGYSDYLHPYDENHIIGLGKDAVEAEEGEFAWYQGLKLALFDVSDPENPKEVSKYAIGDRGTDSYALQDHKAFLFSREKNLLVIPVLLAEIDEGKYAGKVPAYAYGDFVWQGAYVFNLDKENGFELKGRITHMDNAEGRQQMLKGGYYFGSDYSVKRSLYMDDTLYTISDAMIKMNSISDLAEINSVQLQNN